MYDTADNAVAAMIDLWGSVDVDDVFRPILKTAPLTAADYVADVLHHGQLNSLLDSTPLGTTMEQRLDWDQLDRDLRGTGWVHTAGIRDVMRPGSCRRVHPGQGSCGPEAPRRCRVREDDISKFTCHGVGRDPGRVFGRCRSTPRAANAAGTSTAV